LKKAKRDDIGKLGGKNRNNTDKVSGGKIMEEEEKRKRGG